MGPVPKMLSLVLLVGCLGIAVATAGEVACEGPYQGRTPTPEELATVRHNHDEWREARGELSDERRANPCRANLRDADLQGARLLGTNRQGAELDRADLQRVVYEPHPGKLPNFWTLTAPRNHLDKLIFHESAAGLIALREAVKRAGMRAQERQLTYAIEHTKQLHAWNPSGMPLRQKTRGRGCSGWRARARACSATCYSNSHLPTAWPPAVRCGGSLASFPVSPCFIGSPYSA
jgi:Pentapeptide repeats (8 copies)